MMVRERDARQGVSGQKFTSVTVELERLPTRKLVFAEQLRTGLRNLVR
jgi:hypothetical protein